jgi:glycerophosphoryl diester phosphodiesterase
MAYGLGADFLEQDVVATADGQLVVLHDLILDDVSDVASRFPQRRRQDGHFYVVDFTLAELAELRLGERRRRGQASPQFGARFAEDLSLFRVVPFEEEARLVAGLNAVTGRQVGIYPEIKHPVWHAEAGIDIVRLIADALIRAVGNTDIPVFVQSFDPDALRTLRADRRSNWPLVQLLDDAGTRALAGSPTSIDELSDYAAAVGIPYAALITADGTALKPTPLAGQLAVAGLAVHPYTLRRDSTPRGAPEYMAALRFLIRELGVDALFCDFPDDALAVRDGREA